jgi:hypothetical protein
LRSWSSTIFGSLELERRPLRSVLGQRPGDARAARRAER